MKRLFGKEFNFKKIWKNLDTNQRFSLSVLVFLLLSFPVSLLLSLSPVKLFSRAQLPVTPPSTECSAVNRVIRVVPQDRPGCHNIQEAIDNVVGDGYTIRIYPGDYYIPDTGEIYSLRVVGKQNLTIEGDPDSGSKSVRLHFDNNRGGIEVRSSTGSLGWMQITGRTGNGLLRIENSSKFTVKYSHLNDQSANTVQINGGSNITVVTTEVSSSSVAIYPSNVTNLNISHNIIQDANIGVTAYNSSGIIKYNLIRNNGEHALSFAGSADFEIESNTLTENDSSDPGKLTAISIRYPVFGSTDFKFLKNIVAFNNASGVDISEAERVNYSFELNDFYGNTISYVGIPDQTGTNGNISADPLFGDDYCLRSGSPAIYGDYSIREYMGYRGVCGTLPTPTFTLTPTETSVPTPTFTVTPTPPVVSAIPSFTTRYLKPGMSGRRYKTFIRGKDRDRDSLTITARGLPPGVDLKDCETKYSRNLSRITCEISGVPGMSGIYRPVFDLRDDTGAGVTGSYTLFILPKFLP